MRSQVTCEDCKKHGITGEDIYWDKKRETWAHGNCQPDRQDVKLLTLTDLEREVTISLLESALNGWVGHPERQKAAQRVINKLQQKVRP